MDRASKENTMFHSVNGDRWGQRLDLGVSQNPPLTANKGDRGFSDQADARVFLIGKTPNNWPTR